MDFIIYSGVSDLWAISALGAVHHRCVDVPAAVSWSEAARQQESPTCVGAWSPRRSEVCVGTSSLDSEDCCCQQNRRQQTAMCHRGYTHPDTHTHTKQSMFYQSVQSRKCVEFWKNVLHTSGPEPMVRKLSTAVNVPVNTHTHTCSVQDCIHRLRNTDYRPQTLERHRPH